MALEALCIHGHFYQPPREDPFSGAIPEEPGAEPFKNWNERIHAECYRPNTELKNFERISFNVGPTLFEWLQTNHPHTSEQIVHQDLENYCHYGVGNAIAQPYHHTILPLANRQDKETQVKWGIQQFIHRFKHKPQGMWLPETAVDYETLEILAANDIEFTILAPWQAAEVEIDCTEPYRVDLSGGNGINIFFYHPGLSSGISFNPELTDNADLFIRDYVKSQFRSEKSYRGEPQILLVASDGELYGHHQSYRDLFLARLVDGASSQVGILHTFPGLWLKQHPPKNSISIVDNTSWSCHHGTLRWRGDCDCIPTDGRWKAYLRNACDRLADEVDKAFVALTQPLGIDPWKLRNRFIHVMLGEISTENLLSELTNKDLTTSDQKRISLMLNAELHRQKMFTSCGWFFDDFARIEPKNCLAYAAQAVSLVRSAVSEDLSPVILGTLCHVVSHRTGLRGDVVFSQQLDRANEKNKS